MDLRYNAGRSIRHTTQAILEAALVVAIAGALAFGVAVTTGNGPSGAGDVSAAGKLTATISFGSGLRAASVTSGSEVSFEVTRSVPDNDPMIWVSNKCYNASGTLVYWVDLGVKWGTATNLTGSAGPFTAMGAECRAYVTLRPAQGRVLGDAIVRYDVAN